MGPGVSYRFLTEVTQGGWGLWAGILTEVSHEYFHNKYACQDSQIGARALNYRSGNRRRHGPPAMK